MKHSHLLSETKLHYRWKRVGTFDRTSLGCAVEIKCPCLATVIYSQIDFFFVLRVAKRIQVIISLPCLYVYVQVFASASYHLKPPYATLCTTQMNKCLFRCLLYALVR